MKNHSARRSSKRTTFAALLAGLSFVLAAGNFSAASVNDDVGYTKLQTALGGSTPTGAGVNVTQVEANETTNGAQYAPTVGGKTIILRDGASASSGHASIVGNNFYGLGSIAPGVTVIESFNVIQATLPNVTTPTSWLDNFMHVTSGARPSWAVFEQGGYSRVANHSWVGTFANNRADVDVLYRTDWLVETDDFIQVVGINNGANNQRPLLSSAMNTISVGRSNGDHSIGSVPLSITDTGPPNGTYQTIYSAARPRPDLVVPESTTSYATPVVSAAAATLISASKANPSWSKFSYTTGIDPIDSSNRAVQTIRSAETSEVIKATLMAGADRFVLLNTDGSSITTYGAMPTANGLDARYGAGQLNIYNSYRILAAGEQNSIQDTVGSPVDIGFVGFDYDNAFGTTQTQADYEFLATLSGPLQATLAWNIEVDMNKVAAASTNANFATAGTLYNLNLELFDLTLGGGAIVSSLSTTDNTESILATLIAGHRYRMRVSTPSALAGSTEYGLAWTAVPEPSTVLCSVGLGLVALYRFSKRRAEKV